MSATEQIKAATVRDMTPRSIEHWFRFIVGTLLVSAGIFIAVSLVLKNQPLTRDMLFLVFGFGGAGVVIMFTSSIVAVLKVLPVPWKRNGANGA